MFKKTIAAAAVAASLAPALATGAETSPHTITGNVGLFSQYIFRGLTQTNEEPALQGGFDYAHSGGFYAGTWGSNVSVLRDSGLYSAGGSLELDIYGGYKGTIGKTDFGYDVGLLYYWYPGDLSPAASALGFKKADTLELYGALTWKWLSVKLSYALSNEVFGVPNADGTYYLDFTVTYPIPNTKLTLIGHYGMTEYSGTTAGVSNDSFASYKDWKLGVNYSLPKDFTVGVFYTDTSMNSDQEAFYTAAGTKLGDGAVTIFIQKTF
jgi:uncharacterized protein (TIGR02001 family)